VWVVVPRPESKRLLGEAEALAADEQRAR
jgi:hypothetical protein